MSSGESWEDDTQETVLCPGTPTEFSSTSSMPTTQPFAPATVSRRPAGGAQLQLLGDILQRLEKMEATVDSLLGMVQGIRFT
jgi:hypothetical protein